MGIPSLVQSVDSVLKAGSLPDSRSGVGAFPMIRMNFPAPQFCAQGNKNAANDLVRYCAVGIFQHDNILFNSSIAVDLYRHQYKQRKSHRFAPAEAPREKSL